MPVRSLAELRAWLDAAPADTMLQASALRALLAEVADAPQPETAPAIAAPGSSATWRERIWLAPAEVLLGVAEVAEAVGRPKSFVYRAASSKGADRLQATRLDGALTFQVADVRAFMTRRGRASRGELDKAPVSIGSRRRPAG